MVARCSADGGHRSHSRPRNRIGRAAGGLECDAAHDRSGFAARARLHAERDSTRGGGRPRRRRLHIRGRARSALPRHDRTGLERRPEDGRAHPARARAVLALGHARRDHRRGRGCCSGRTAARNDDVVSAGAGRLDVRRAAGRLCCRARGRPRTGGPPDPVHAVRKVEGSRRRGRERPRLGRNAPGLLDRAGEREPVRALRASQRRLRHRRGREHDRLRRSERRHQPSRPRSRRRSRRSGFPRTRCRHA